MQWKESDPGPRVQAACLTILLASLFALAACGAPPGSTAAGARAAETGTTGAPATGQPAPAGTFRVTAQQFAALGVQAVARQAFRSEEVTDGKIALNGNHLTQVFSPYSGRVTQVLAKPGDSVKAGTPLLQLEASEFAQAVNDLQAAVSSVATARAQATLAETTASRKQALFEARGGSLQDAQQSQNDLIVARDTLRSAETAAELVRNRLRIFGKTASEIATLETAPRVAPLAYVVAPIAGTVTDRQVGIGQFLQSGASIPVFTIGNLSSVWLLANVRETAAAGLRRGQEIEVRLPALPGQTLRGRIDYIASGLDPATHRLPVRAEIANPGGVLKPEMFASFTIGTSAARQGLAVPESAVIYEGDQARVWVVAGADTLALRTIRAGRSAQGQVEVIEGLQPGDRVVTSGSLFIDRAAHDGG